MIEVFFCSEIMEDNGNSLIERVTKNDCLTMMLQNKNDDEKHTIVAEIFTGLIDDDGNKKNILGSEEIATVLNDGNRKFFLVSGEIATVLNDGSEISTDLVVSNIEVEMNDDGMKEKDSFTDYFAHVD